MEEKREGKPSSAIETAVQQSSVYGSASKGVIVLRVANTLSSLICQQALEITKTMRRTLLTKTKTTTKMGWTEKMKRKFPKKIRTKLNLAAGKISTCTPYTWRTIYIKLLLLSCTHISKVVIHLQTTETRTRTQFSHGYMNSTHIQTETLNTDALNTSMFHPLVHSQLIEKIIESNEFIKLQNLFQWMENTHLWGFRLNWKFN